jgi:protocatechuate 3,4-dioxygenase beta subunit
MKKEENAGRHMSRREVLGLIGAAGVVAVVGCGEDDSNDQQTSTATTAATATRTSGATASATPAPVACVVTPEQTEGPYFVDERLNRSDLRSDPTDGSVKEGVPLSLTLTVSTVSGTSCTPLAGAVVDMWHCDALGVYSDVSGGAGQGDTTGQKFLRGYQLTDQNGQAAFQTIYPGWYSGRTIHIHFKVRTDADSAQGFEFTSQLFFDEQITDSVVARAPYSDKGAPDTRNAADNIFDSDLIVPLIVDGDGYAGTFHVGVNMA